MQHRFDRFEHTKTGIDKHRHGVHIDDISYNCVF